MPVIGIWTPSARVVCATCHGPDSERGSGPIWKTPEEYRTACEGDIEVTEDEIATTCQECGKAIVIDPDVGVLREIQRRTEVGTMEQTGGMCSGLRIERPGSRFLFVSALDGQIVIGLYTEAGWEDADAEAIWETSAHYDVAEALVHLAYTYDIRATS